MRCDRFLVRYDSLEPGRALSSGMAYHLRDCESCKAQVERFEAALGSWRSVEQDKLAEESLLERAFDRTMVSVRLTRGPRREMSLAQWAFPAALISSSLVFLPFVVRQQGALIEAVLLPMALVLGIGITLFGSLFIGSHVESLKDAIERDEGPMHYLLR